MYNFFFRLPSVFEYTRTYRLLHPETRFCIGIMFTVLALITTIGAHTPNVIFRHFQTAVP